MSLASTKFDVRYNTSYLDLDYKDMERVIEYDLLILVSLKVKYTLWAAISHEEHCARVFMQAAGKVELLPVRWQQIRALDRIGLFEELSSAYSTEKLVSASLEASQVGITALHDLAGAIIVAFTLPYVARSSHGVLGTITYFCLKTM